MDLPPSLFLSLSFTHSSIPHQHQSISLCYLTPIVGRKKSRVFLRTAVVAFTPTLASKNSALFPIRRHLAVTPTPAPMNLALFPQPLAPTCFYIRNQRISLGFRCCKSNLWRRNSCCFEKGIQNFGI